MSGRLKILFLKSDQHHPVGCRIMMTIISTSWLLILWINEPISSFMIINFTVFIADVLQGCKKLLTDSILLWEKF